jgi:ubiquinone/menaquinone biosynthesis C-methylase UbiE
MAPRRDTLLAAQYFAAVAGMAAMRSCLTHPTAARPRLDDVRGVVEHLDEFPNDLEIPVLEHDVAEGYAAWAPRYDGPNPAVEAETPVVLDILERAPRGAALDAACGTGRHAEHLRSLGYDVVGVDATEAMLAVARAKVPDADFRQGPLQALPVDDASVDVVTCSLALTHVEDLDPVVAEFARVLRPGGWAVLADIHPVFATFGGAAFFPGEGEGMELRYVPNLVHLASEYVQAATAAGLEVAECHEPTVPESAIVTNPAFPVLPDAVRAAFDGLPSILVWRLTKPGRR